MKKSFFTLVIGLGALLLMSCSGNDIINDTQNANELATKVHKSGFVFEDINKNGQFDSDEIGLKGINITYDHSIVTTDNNGEYFIVYEKDTESELTIITVPEGYELTTDNLKQTVSVDALIEPIGLAISDRISGEDEIYFTPILNANHADVQNYAFDLFVINDNVLLSSLKYASNQERCVIEDENFITYFFNDSRSTGIYLKDANQVVVSPKLETMEITTPFTVIDILDAKVFDAMVYAGNDVFEGKPVYVFKSKDPDYDVEIYVWDEYNLIVKMIVPLNGTSTVITFSNLVVNEVEDSVFNYPEDVEIVELSCLKTQPVMILKLQ